jgi:hypothetical protein
MAHYSVSRWPRQSARVGGGTALTPQRSVKMKYRGVAYSVVRGSPPNVWRWTVMVGKPAMLRMGDEETEREASRRVHEIIDRALDVQEALRFLNPSQRTGG